MTFTFVAQSLRHVVLRHHGSEREGQRDSRVVIDRLAALFRPGNVRRTFNDDLHRLEGKRGEKRKARKGYRGAPPD